MFRTSAIQLVSTVVISSCTPRFSTTKTADSGPSPVSCGQLTLCFMTLRLERRTKMTQACKRGNLVCRTNQALNGDDVATCCSLPKTNFRPLRNQQSAAKTQIPDDDRSPNVTAAKAPHCTGTCAGRGEPWQPRKPPVERGRPRLW